MKLRSANINPVVLVGFNNPLVSTGGLGTVMKTTCAQFSDLRVVCHDSSAHGHYCDVSSKHHVFPIRIPQQLVQQYQRQFCKLYVWPKLHDEQVWSNVELPTKTSTRHILPGVHRFAQAFAEHLIDVVRPMPSSSLVWFNDYSMIPVAAYFRKRMGKRYPVGISIRSSFGVTKPPSFDGQTSSLMLNGLLSADFISVHRDRDAFHLLDFASAVHGSHTVNWAEKSIAHTSHRTFVQTVQMGNSAEYWNSAGQSATAHEVLASILATARNLKVFLSVSRLEPHKGIEFELEVIERFLRYFPHRRNSFVFYRIMPIFPEYTGVERYQRLQRNIEAHVARINASFGDKTWQPVVLLGGPSLKHDELAGFYRAADVVMVLSHADGFNHVSIEASLAKQRGDPPLSLLLSDTGSSDYLKGAYTPADMRSPAQVAIQLENLLRADPTSQKSVENGLEQAASARSSREWTREVLGSIINCFMINEVGTLDSRG